MSFPGIHSIAFPKGFSRSSAGAPLFPVGHRFDFRPGLNLLVGDQGAGKSTLLWLLRAWAAVERKREHSQAVAAYSVGVTDREFVEQGVQVEWDGPFTWLAFDFEHENPRIGDKLKDGMGIVPQLLFRRMSHGEWTKAMLANVAELAGPAVLLADEPDTGLSPRSARKLAEAYAAMAERGVQLLVACHHPTVIARSAEVLSVEHGRWMPSAEFLALHEENAP